MCENYPLIAIYDLAFFRKYYKKLLSFIFTTRFYNEMKDRPTYCTPYFILQMMYCKNVSMYLSRKHFILVLTIGSCIFNCIYVFYLYNYVLFMQQKM
jgi:hypothetical protein